MRGSLGWAVRVVNFDDEGQARLEATDLVVADTESVEDPEHVEQSPNGIALTVLGRGSAQVERGLFARSRGFGVAALGSGVGEPDLSLTDVAVVATRRAACGDIPAGSAGSCIDPGGQSRAAGSGLVATDGGSIVVEAFRVEGAEEAGLVVGRTGRLEARRGTATGNGIGINVVDPDYDMTLLSDEVLVYGNGVDVARQDIVVPDAADFRGWLPQ